MNMGKEGHTVVVVAPLFSYRPGFSCGITHADMHAASVHDKHAAVILVYSTEFGVELS